MATTTTLPFIHSSSQDSTTHTQLGTPPHYVFHLFFLARPRQNPSALTTHTPKSSKAIAAAVHRTTTDPPPVQRNGHSQAKSAEHLLFNISSWLIQVSVDLKCSDPAEFGSKAHFFSPNCSFLDRQYFSSWT